MRKRFSGDREASVALLGLAKDLLRELRRSMEFNKLLVGQRSIDLGEGKFINVSSVFGQDEITIHVPPIEAQGLIDAVVEAEGANTSPEFKLFDAKQRDMVFVDSVVTLTITVYDEVVIGPGPSPGSGTSDIITFTGSVRLTVVTTTPAPPYTPPPAPIQIVIGGHIGNDPAVWDNVNGLRRLGLRNSFSEDERYGQVQGLSDDGSLPYGYVERYDNAINPALTNPNTGATKPFGYLSQACVWSHGTGDANCIQPRQAGDVSAATYMSADKGTIKGPITYGRAGGGSASGTFRWNGKVGFTDSYSLINESVPALPGTTSKNGRIKVQGDKYNLDNGPWITYAAGMVGLCSAHIPYTPPTPPSTAPTVKTTVLVFSG